jgi:hypothetical protein
MRRLLAFALLLVFLTPIAPAGADPLPPSAYAQHKDCRRLTRQIARYADVVDMARERDDDLWAEHTLEHIGRLSERRAKLCPQYADKPSGEKLLALLKTAAKIALKLYTWGLI